MRVAAVIVVAVLALASGAAAKGPTTAHACGVSGCRLGDPELLSPDFGRPFGPASPPRPAPYYVAFVSSAGPEGFCWQIVWVPRRHVLRLGNVRPYVPTGGPVNGRYWRTVDPAFTRRLARGFGGIKPFPAVRSWKSPAARCAR